MSPIRTPSRKSAKFTIVIASSALALTAVAVGTAAASASATTRPALAAGAPQPAQAAAAPPSHTLRSGPDGNASLDGTAQLFRQAQRASTQSVSGVGGGSSGSHRRHRPGTPRQIARGLLHRFHWSQRQFKYLNWLWDRESSWNKYATNPFSGAYGIPQAVPGSKMASAGPNWRTSATTQIRWGLGYIRDVYGSPQAAWDHELAVGWY